MQAILFVRGGNNHGIPLEFIRIQPYTIPANVLSDLSADVWALPTIVRLKVPVNQNLCAG